MPNPPDLAARADRLISGPRHFPGGTTHGTAAGAFHKDHRTMVRFLKYFALPFLMGASPARPIGDAIQIMPLAESPASVRLHRWGAAPGKSKRTVAQDKRRAAKVRARNRAKKLGHA